MNYLFEYYNTETCLKWNCLIYLEDKEMHANFVNFLCLFASKYPYIKLSLYSVEE